MTIPYPAHLTAANDREGLGGMAIGEGAVWVIGDASDPRLWRIDPRRHRIVATIRLGLPACQGGRRRGRRVGRPTSSTTASSRSTRPTNRVVRSIPVGRGAGGVAVGGGSVWVTGAIDHTVTRVEPSTGRVVSTIPVTASPQAVAVGDGGVWVAGDAR